MKVAINGFGRIGRNFLRAAMKDPEFGKGYGTVAVNDITDAKTLPHLLKCDSAFGIYPTEIRGERGRRTSPSCRPPQGQPPL